MRPSPWRRFPALLMARRNLTRTKVRTGLAMLGIVIGVVAIASLGVFGATLQASITGSLGEIGNQLIVSPSGEDDVTALTDRDVREIERVAGNARVVPMRQDQAALAIRGEQRRVTVYGMDAPADAYVAAEGRIPDPLRSGAVIGASLADEFDLSPGESISLGGETYRVRAVLEPQEAFTPVNPDSAVILPTRDVPAEGYSQVVVTAESGPAANETAVAIRAALNDRETRVTIFELGDIVGQIGAVFEAVQVFLVAIGSISLLVAGVSILNVMLMSAIERREEIGVLRAVGYQRTDVLRIMLSEALLLGTLGGIVGGVLSLGGGLLINQLIVGDAMAVFTTSNLGYILAAFGFAVITSVVSGLYPAYKAANEHPVDALRK